MTDELIGPGNASGYYAPPVESSPWISVKDKLPPCGEKVLTYGRMYSGDHFMLCRRLKSKAKNQEWKSYGSFGNYRYGNITHWQPLTPP